MARHAASAHNKSSESRLAELVSHINQSLNGAISITHRKQAQNKGRKVRPSINHDHDHNHNEV